MQQIWSCSLLSSRPPLTSPCHPHLSPRRPHPSPQHSPCRHLPCLRGKQSHLVSLLCGLHTYLLFTYTCTCTCTICISAGYDYNLSSISAHSASPQPQPKLHVRGRGKGSELFCSLLFTCYSDVIFLKLLFTFSMYRICKKHGDGTRHPCPWNRDCQPLHPHPPLLPPPAFPQRKGKGKGQGQRKGKSE